MQHGPARAHRNHGQRVGHVLGGQRGAFQRVEGDIHARAVARAHFFADKQHRGFVTLSFSDDDHALDVELVQFGPHRIHGRLVCGLFIAAANQFGTGDCRLLGDAGQAQ